MLEKLNYRVSTKVPQILPIPQYLLTPYLGAFVNGRINGQEFWQSLNEYSLATVSFSYNELRKLSERDFLVLQDQLRRSIQLFYSQIGQTVPRRSNLILTPGSKTNILTHEKEHLNPLPKKIRNVSRVDIIFQKNLLEQVSLDGVAVWDMNLTTSKEIAVSFSEPQSLSQQDVDEARRYAAETRDSKFKAYIEKRIKERTIHTF